MLVRRNAHYSRGRDGRLDPRAGVSRKRTAWPGQHVRCGVCGRLYYWGGHGQTRYMMCSGAANYHCWNVATFDGRMAAERLGGAILATVEALPEFDERFRARVEAATRARRSERADAVRKLDRDLEHLGHRLVNVLDSIERTGFSPALQSRLRELEARKAELEAGRADLKSRPEAVPELPPVAELKTRAREAVGDPEFGRLMRQLVVRLEVLPYRLLDGRKVVLRAGLTLDLAVLLTAGASECGEVFRQELMVDLFDLPQRADYREQVVGLRAVGRTEQQAAAVLGLTVTAAHNAMALHRRMQELGVTDPFQPVTEPPGGRIRRHRHRRYQFDPLPGYPAWPPPGTI